MDRPERSGREHEGRTSSCKTDSITTGTLSTLELEDDASHDAGAAAPENGR